MYGYLSTLFLVSVATLPSELPPCGTLPAEDARPSWQAVDGRWESCKADLPPGCTYGAYTGNILAQPMHLSGSAAASLVSRMTTEIFADFHTFVNGQINTISGTAAFKFCPSSTRMDYCNGISGSINAHPIYMTEQLFGNGFDAD